jgi:hypothetical protein
MAENTTRDLSEIHGLVSNMLTWPKSDEEWQKFRLTDEQIAFFREYGYLCGIRLLHDEQIEILRAELSGLMSKSHPANHLNPINLIPGRFCSTH